MPRKINIDWREVFGNSYPDSDSGINLVCPSSAPHAAAVRAGPAGAKRARRAGKEGVARASSGDEQPPRGTQALHLRLEALYSDLERRVGQLTKLRLQEAADREQDAHFAAENVHNSNQEDEQGEHVACKYCCLKCSPVLVTREKNHEQADGDRKRVARPAAKSDDKEPAPPEEIFDVLREIPSLDRADVLRAYSMLIRDDRLFRSLVALPKDMRNDWLLMEIGNQ